MKRILQITGQKIPVEIMSRREGDPAQLVVDNTKAKEILKWTLEKTLHDSIKTAYESEKVLPVFSAEVRL